MRWSGRKIGGNKDLAQAAQVWRDPRVEHLKYVWIDNDTGEVLDVETHSSRAVGMVEDPIYTDGQRDPRKTFGHVNRVARLKKRASGGNVGLYLLHNHPSGDSAPSQDDVGFTNKWNKIVGAQEVTLRRS